MTAPSSRAVGVWLAAVTTLVFSLVVLGGVTRLTRSGLSIVVWEPISGAIPPLTAHDWNEAFAAYRQTPEGRIVNSAMDLEGFKSIFLVEYAHRLLGRMIGLVFFLPLAFFAWKRRLEPWLLKRLAFILALGATQGLVGWLMVKSGLNDAPHVSPHRLVMHLGMGLLIFGFLVWTTLDVFEPSRTRGGRLHWAGWALAFFTWVTVLAGGYVAGTRAGFAFNTFPLLNGAWIPKGLWAGTPWWDNLFENVLTIQFVHRWLAKLLFLAVVALWFAARVARADRASRLATDGLLAAAALQVSLGITTLLFHVPVWLGATHQGGSLLVLTMALVTTHRLREGRRVRVPAKASAKVASATPVQSGT